MSKPVTTYPHTNDYVNTVLYIVVLYRHLVVITGSNNYLFIYYIDD